MSLPIRRLKDKTGRPQFLLLVSTLLFAGFGRVGAPVRLTASIEWIKTFQPEIGTYCYGWDVKQTLDGGYIIAGSVHYWTVVYPDYYRTIRSHIYLFRTDGTGQLLWQKTYMNSGDEDAFSVLPTVDGGFILTGFTTSFGAGGDVYLMKTDGWGNMLWQKTFGGSGSDVGRSLQPAPDGGYIIVGETSSFGAGNADIYLIRTDGFGNLLWQNAYGGPDSDQARSVQPTPDGGFIIAGTTQSVATSNSDIALLKVDQNGNLLWQKAFGGERREEGWSVQPTYDGGYAVAGFRNDPGGYLGSGEDNIYLLKTDGLGNLLWEKTYGGSLSDRAYCLLQTFDGGFIIGGVSAEVSFQDGGPCLLRTDQSGLFLWQKVFQTDLFPTRISSVQQTYEGGFIATGSETGYGGSSGHWGVPLYKLGTEELFQKKKTLPREIRR